MDRHFKITFFMLPESVSQQQYYPLFLLFWELYYIVQKISNLSETIFVEMKAGNSENVSFTAKPSRSTCFHKDFLCQFRRQLLVIFQSTTNFRLLDKFLLHFCLMRATFYSNWYDESQRFLFSLPNHSSTYYEKMQQAPAFGKRNLKVVTLINTKCLIYALNLVLLASTVYSHLKEASLIFWKSLKWVCC